MMNKECEMQCCKLKSAEWKIAKIKEFLESPVYHKTSTQYYTVNDELTKIANKILGIIGE